MEGAVIGALVGMLLGFMAGHEIAQLAAKLEEGRRAHRAARLRLEAFCHENDGRIWSLLPAEEAEALLAHGRRARGGEGLVGERPASAEPGPPARRPVSPIPPSASDPAGK